MSSGSRFWRHLAKLTRLCCPGLSGVSYPADLRAPRVPSRPTLPSKPSHNLPQCTTDARRDLSKTSVLMTIPGQILVFVEAAGLGKLVNSPGQGRCSNQAFSARNDCFMEHYGMTPSPGNGFHAVFINNFVFLIQFYRCSLSQ